MDQNIENSLIHQLNIHGYGFQYSVLNYIKTLFEKNSLWIFEVSEFPVFIKNNSIHIDFIFRKISSNFFLVCECKRANPSISNWCFVKTPFVSRKFFDGEYIVREVISHHNDIDYPPETHITSFGLSHNVYRLGFEIKSQIKGDSGQGKGQINDAVSQVLRGQNGLINLFASEIENGNEFSLGLSSSYHYAAFFPVIFTTAKLYVSNHDLKNTDLTTGTIVNLSEELEEKNWLFYQYNQSPNISHSLYINKRLKSLSEALLYGSTRTVAIVNVNGIQEFFNQFSKYYEEDWENK